MTIEECLAGAEAHYDNREYLEAISLCFIGFLTALMAVEEDDDW